MVLTYHTTSLPESLIHTGVSMASTSQQAHKRGRPVGASRLVAQARNIVHNVYKYFDDQFNDTPVQDIVKMTSEATGVSQSLVQIRWQGRSSEDGVITSPPRKKIVSPVLGNTDDFDKEVIRKEVLAFYARGELPTLELLLNKISSEKQYMKKGQELTHQAIEQVTADNWKNIIEHTRKIKDEWMMNMMYLMNSILK